jgi:AmmeMemoRadiSam system protein B
MSSTLTHPQLRQVEVRPSTFHPGALDLMDPAGIAQSVITVSGPLLLIISQMTGRRSRADIQAEFMRKTGRLLFSDELDDLLSQFDEALFLEGGRFEARMAELIREYRQAPLRALRDRNSFGAPADALGHYLDAILDHHTPSPRSSSAGRLLGLVAPHLDYARGGPCYAAAYRDLAERTDAVRFVILGTNHFGRSSAVVGTRKDFETPFGTVPHDGEFLETLSKRCGVELCENEYDHVREHSVELQVILLKRALPNRAITIAPFLCPDPCGVTGTAPVDDRVVDLMAFAVALRDQLASDPKPTCIIAGADLSHIGRYFQDDRKLDKPTLSALEKSDRRLLADLAENRPETFRQAVAGTGNESHICSVGCLYALGTALNDRARPKLLHYHQAVTAEAENCVTCAAMEYCEA